MNTTDSEQRAELQRVQQLIAETLSKIPQGEEGEDQAIFDPPFPPDDSAMQPETRQNVVPLANATERAARRR